MTDVIAATGAFGYDTLTDRLWHLDVPFVNGHASDDVVAGDVVSVGVDGKVLPATTAIGEILVVGVAVDTFGPGEVGLVTIKGAATARAQGAIAAAAAVNRSGSSAGAVSTGATIALGVAIAAASGGVVDIWITK